MSPSEVREVVADLLDETPTVMPDGRMRGQEWRPAGVHRRGETQGGADVRWYETAMEGFERTAWGALRECMGSAAEAPVDGIGDDLRADCPQCRRRVKVTARGNIRPHLPGKGTACGRADCNGLCTQAGVTYMSEAQTVAARAFKARLSERRAA